MFVKREVKVTPYVGVWIETQAKKAAYQDLIVTPYVGVWIETPVDALSSHTRKSHPTWVCGLKRVSSVD